jgi:hemoglobin
MKTLFVYLTLAASVLVAPLASAQSTQMPSAKNDALYQAFGQQAGLNRLMDDFVARLLADARMEPHFRKADQPNLKKQLVDQLCSVSGGPCVYKGADMKTSHGNLDITKADFNALVEVLQLSMDAQGIAFGAQNQMLAKLAPMHRDVITVRD